MRVILPRRVAQSESFLVLLSSVYQSRAFIWPVFFVKACRRCTRFEEHGHAIAMTSVIPLKPKEKKVQQHSAAIYYTCPITHAYTKKIYASPLQYTHLT